MAHLAEMRIDPKVVNDQFGRLSFTQEIARAVGHLIQVGADYGTYNVTNSGKVKSWADIAAETFELAGYDSARVSFITTDEYSKDKLAFAPRPIHSDLDLKKLQATGFISQDYAPMLKEYIANLAPAE
jgi:dTDP-4-dehydrorhamnose 3,5-epimerase